MRLLRHITVAFFIVCLFALILVIIGCLFDNSYPGSRKTRPLPNEQIDLYPNSLSLLDQWDFRYVINNDVCSASDNRGLVTAALIVTSHAGDVEGRKAIRLAYPAEELERLGIRRVFLLALLKAKTTNDKYKTVAQSALVEENEHFSDLVQGNFYEAYRNLTYKHVMGLQWATRYCKEAKFIIKMDDDIIVDFYRLMDLMKLNEAKNGGDLLMGYVIRGMQPVHDKSSKWFVTRREYSKSFYPPFLSGWMYVTTPETAKKLIEISKTVRFFWIDDTYITGILAKNAKIKHININGQFAIHPEYLECCINRGKGLSFTCDYMVGPTGGDYNLLLRFKRYATACYVDKCPQREPIRALNKTCVTEKKFPPLGKGKAKIVPYNLF